MRGEVTQASGLKIRTKLLIVGMSFLVIPLLGYWYATEFALFLKRGHEEALLLSAQAVSTALYDRRDIFYPEQTATSTEKITNGFSATPFPGSVTTDGEVGDWSYGTSKQRSFGREDGNGPFFKMASGFYKDRFFLLLSVLDDKLVYRSQNTNRLDSSDHVRITLFDEDDEPVNYLVTAYETGPATAYETGEDWKYMLDSHPEGRIRGAIKESEEGYIAELDLPREMLGKSSTIKVGVADVDQLISRRVSSVTQAIIDPEKDYLKIVFKRPPEFERIFSGLNLSDTSVWIIDPHGRVQTHLGKSIERDYNPTSTRRNDLVINSAMGGSGAVRTRSSLDNTHEIIMAAAPILAEDNTVLGAVLIERSADIILLLQKEALSRAVWVTVAAFLLVTFALLRFSGQLTFRIHRLRDEASQAIDERGKVRQEFVLSGRNKADEIGDLARAFNSLIKRLSGYTGFLERLPRTLRHEMNNPLNTISVSLQNLTDDVPHESEKYLNSATRGVERMREIVNRLTEAASVEEALAEEVLYTLDLGAIVSRYVNNISSDEIIAPIKFVSRSDSVFIKGSDYRIEQLLDKLIDNAAGFRKPESSIIVSLRKREAICRIKCGKQWAKDSGGRTRSTFRFSGK